MSNETKAGKSKQSKGKRDETSCAKTMCSTHSHDPLHKEHGLSMFFHCSLARSLTNDRSYFVCTYVNADEVARYAARAMVPEIFMVQWGLF
jgi:hypothetical protein